MGNRTVVTPLRLPWPGLALVTILAVLVVACGRGGDDAGDAPPAEQQQQPEAAPAEQITLQCNAECAARGQCGKTADGSDVVLLNLEGPAVEPAEHDLVAPANVPVTIREVRPVTLLEEATGAQFQRNFHRVLVSQLNVEGWVAGWCLAGPVP